MHEETVVWRAHPRKMLRITATDTKLRFAVSQLLERRTLIERTRSLFGLPLYSDFSLNEFPLGLRLRFRRDLPALKVCLRDAHLRNAVSRATFLLWMGSPTISEEFHASRSILVSIARGPAA